MKYRKLFESENWRREVRRSIGEVFGARRSQRKNRIWLFWIGVGCD